MADLDYGTVRRYWNAAQPSILASYVITELGLTCNSCPA